MKKYKRNDIVKDKLGEYRVLSVGIDNKPTTLEYYAYCDFCFKVSRFTGSLTTRQKTLQDTQTSLCPTCGAMVNWNIGRINIPDGHPESKMTLDLGKYSNHKLPSYFTAYANKSI